MGLGHRSADPFDTSRSEPLRLAVEIWSPLPPQASGVADYVHEQLEVLDRRFDLTLVAEDPPSVAPEVRDRYRVVSPAESDGAALRVYHIGNSPDHGFIYREATRTPGVVVLHEWNLHELLLGFAVRSGDFEPYRAQMRREHGERGSVAAGLLSAALGGRFWSAKFPLNAEILEGALAVVCLSASTAARAAARLPGVHVLHLPLHAVVRSHAGTRAEARARLGLRDSARVIVAPGLGNASKSLDLARSCIDSLARELGDVLLLTVGGGLPMEEEGLLHGSEQRLGRVDLETLGDTLFSADIVLALRFPSRGEASGALMRALAAGRASIVSSGSTADEDLPPGVVARVNPGPSEGRELGAILRFLLQDQEARERMEALALATALLRQVEPMTARLADFLTLIADERKVIEARLRERAALAATIPGPFRIELEAAAAGLGLARLPIDAFVKLAGI